MRREGLKSTHRPPGGGAQRDAVSGACLDDSRPGQERPVGVRRGQSRGLSSWSPSTCTVPVPPRPQSRPCGSGDRCRLLPGTLHSWQRYAQGSSLRRMCLSSLCFGLIAPSEAVIEFGNVNSSTSSPRKPSFQSSTRWGRQTGICSLSLDRPPWVRAHLSPQVSRCSVGSTSLLD